MSLIVDASVAVKWYLPENDSDRAEEILSTPTALLAPDLILAEVGNAVWKRVRDGRVAREDALRILDRLTSAFGILVPLATLARDAMEISTAFNHPIYDCFYLALARREKQTLVTFDRRLAKVAERMELDARLLR